MKYIALLSILLACPTFCHAQTQWPGNGHYYQLVSPSQGISWSDANAAAAGSSFQGMPGYLVTLNSIAEWDFVRTTFPHQFTWIGFTDSALEDTYVWVTGEPVNFTAWLAGEPNNAATDPPGEDYAWYEQRDGIWGWNDYRDVPLADTGPQQFPIAYVVEFSAVPEPASLLLTVTAPLVYLLHRRRRTSR